jgi:hypothetical protein
MYCRTPACASLLPGASIDLESGMPGRDASGNRFRYVFSTIVQSSVRSIESRARRVDSALQNRSPDIRTVLFIGTGTVSEGDVVIVR